jgi:DNA-directed RNA polymerase specialized sigma24 family protein
MTQQAQPAGAESRFTSMQVALLSAQQLRPHSQNRVAFVAPLGCKFDTRAPRRMTKQGSADLDPAAVRAALAGDAGAVQRLIETLSPVVQARVARTLLRRPESRMRDVRQDVADLTQEVFVALFADDAKALKAWDPNLGLSLVNFVGLLAQRRAASILRVKRRMPWQEESAGDDLPVEPPAHAQREADAQIGSRDLLQRLFDRLQVSLSPRGLELFYRLYVDEQAIEDVCAQTGMNAAAVYQWKSRLGKAARDALEELQGDRPHEQRQRGAV